MATKAIGDKRGYIGNEVDFKKMRVEIEKRFNAQIIWTVSTGMGIIGILLVIFKLK